MAGGLGFEPRLAESESAVLPLDDPPIFPDMDQGDGISKSGYPVRSSIAVGRSVLAKSIRPSQASSGHWRFPPDLMRIWMATFNLWLRSAKWTRFPNNRDPFVRPKEKLLYLQHELVRLDKSNRYRSRQLQGEAWRARGLEVDDRDTAER